MFPALYTVDWWALLAHCSKPRANVPRCPACAAICSHSPLNYRRCKGKENLTPTMHCVVWSWSSLSPHFCYSFLGVLRVFLQGQPFWLEVVRMVRDEARDEARVRNSKWSKSREQALTEDGFCPLLSASCNRPELLPQAGSELLCLVHLAVQMLSTATRILPPATYWLQARRPEIMTIVFGELNFKGSEDIRVG